MPDIVGKLFEGTLKVVGFPLLLIKKIGMYGIEEIEDEENQIRTTRLQKFLWFCLYTSIFITIFAVGGIITVFIGMIYTYLAIYKKFKCFNSKIPDESCDL